MDFRTKTHRKIFEAYEKGYRVTEDGRLFSPYRELNIKLCGKQRYPTFGTNWDGQAYGVPIHQLAAFCFYGFDSFPKDMVIRHLDGNTLNVKKENIVLGTHSQNNLDKSPEARSAAAKKARASQGITSLNAKLNKEQVLYIRDAYKSLGDRKKAPNGFTTGLAKMFNTTRTTIDKVRTGAYYANYID